MGIRLTRAQARELGLDLATQSKYRAVRTEYNGVVYDSKAEAERAKELDLLLNQGNILDWIAQPVFRLGVAENKYRPDFLIIPKEGRPWVEDIKGHETPKFKRDKRLWESHGRLWLFVLAYKGGEFTQTGCIQPRTRRTQR